MTLGDKQRLFTRMLANLLEFAHSRGYEATLGDAYRDPRLHGHIGDKVAYGHRNSAHKIRLAIDLNLFFQGKYLTNTKDHEPLGLYWESLHPLCKWGGRFGLADGNHYSFEHNGNK